MLKESLIWLCRFPLIPNDLGERTVVAMSLLNSMETVLVVMEDLPEVCLALEPILLQVVTFILDKSIMEFYEEAFSLMSSLTEKQVSPAMWSVFEGTYRYIVFSYFPRLYSLICKVLINSQETNYQQRKLNCISCRVIERDGIEYFIEMMPCLHNYITVDTDAFLADPNRLLAICNIVKRVSY